MFAVVVIGLAFFIMFAPIKVQKKVVSYMGGTILLNLLCISGTFLAMECHLEYKNLFLYSVGLGFGQIIVLLLIIANINTDKYLHGRI